MADEPKSNEAMDDEEIEADAVDVQEYTIVEEEEEIEPEESILTEYDPDDFLSGAVTSLDSSMPQNLFEFENSYGYNCHKYFNICACDEQVVCWAAGSIITFFDVMTKQMWFRRTSTGGSVGNITSYRIDPNYRIAVAECGEGEHEPLILIYTWPQMDIDAVLRDGTANAYSILDFSPNGELLASVGREPDYNITIWNWKRHKILLRTSAFTFDVNTVMFSPYCPGQLATAGAAHIKFWKMAETFTGLKLKGELGRFGKTEICDVLGVYPMPDEKVLSGCEWGNILVWEAGLVKLEVTQKARKRCHNAPVVQFMLSPAGDEVTSIAQDGCVRVWYWDTVDQADPPEDDPYVELNPVAETCVPGCRIMTLKHQKEMFWFAQDGNGGIWVVELEIDKLECEHRKVLTCHSGGIVGMAALRTYPILITAGEDGALHAYNTETFTLLARYQFPDPVTFFLYPPLDVDETSRIIIVGFADGIMRTLLLHPERLKRKKTFVEVRIHSSLTIHSEDSIHADVMEMISLLKPHSQAITHITINEQRTLLVTASKDSTIFMYKLVLTTPFQLERLGFIETPNVISYMTWKPGATRVLAMCGQVGLLMEAMLPAVDTRRYEDITTFKLQFDSYKESLVKKNYMRRRPFPEEEDLASIDEETLKARSEAEDHDEPEEEWLGEIQLVESESMLGTTLTWAEYCKEGMWVIQKGTGSLFLIKPGNNKIWKYAPIPGAWCDDITFARFICERRYLILGTNNGYIRVVRMPTEKEDTPQRHLNVWLEAQKVLLKKLKGRRLAKEEKQPIPRIDFEDYYYLPMHDRTSSITCFDFSADGTKMYTCGSDGNIFSYFINFSEPLFPGPEPPEHLEKIKVEPIREPSTVEGEVMSHEQLKRKEEYDKMMAIANAHKKRVREQLAALSVEYNKVIKANKLLPISQQINVTLDPRPLEVQERELDEAKALVIRKLAHQLEASDLGLKKMYNRNIIQLDVFPFTLMAIRDPKDYIRPLRQKNLSQAFQNQLEEVHQKMAEAALKGRNISQLLLEQEEQKHAETSFRRVGQRKVSYGPPRIASFLLGLPPRPPHPLKKAIRNYHNRLNRHHVQFIEWQEHLNRKPDPNAMPPGAAEALKEAEMTIGNRLLKTQPDYIAPPGHNTQLRVCLARKEIYDNKHEFNLKVLELRDHKVYLVQKMRDIGDRLNEIRVEIPARSAKSPPEIPDIDDDLEFPEKNLEICPETLMSQTRISHRKSRNSRRKSSVHPGKPMRVPRFLPITEIRPSCAIWEIVRQRQDMDSTPTETERRERRIERHLFEQDMLVIEAEDAIDRYDARLKELQRERIRVQEKNALIELHLWQLHREMNVLNRFEAHEDALAERVYAKLMQVRGVEQQILDCEHRIIEHENEKESLITQCAEIQVEFKKLVTDNKFADFLRRIFKKKYRPPRVHDDDESTESESSSSSSDEEDEGSLDSRDIGPIRLDPNICPEGCEREIYDQTYELRNTRHKYEQEMMEQDRLVEMLHRDIEAHNKVKRKLSLQLDIRKNELREFMLEKQSCMNEVDQVVVLRYDQIRASALQGCTGPAGLSQTVVFPEAMLSRLRKRVLELQLEIKQQKIRQKVNRTHLFRMNVDLRAMEKEAQELRAKMRDVLTRKLGKPRRVDRTLDDLLRQMARRHKYSANMDIMPQIHAQLMNWRKRYSTLEQKYIVSTNEYATRLRLAAALQSEVLPCKAPKDHNVMPGAYQPSDYHRDVIRLRIIRQQQEQHIQQLLEETNAMRLKPLSELSYPRGYVPPPEVKSDIILHIPHRRLKTQDYKYFPIAPLTAAKRMYHDVNIVKMLHDCLDAMRVTRDDANLLLKDVTDSIHDIIAGTISRYDAIDQLVCKWLKKGGGDPTQYKKQTRAFDAFAALTDRLVREQLEYLNTEQKIATLAQIEEALKEVSGPNESLQNRLGPALAALLESGDLRNIETAETMTSVVKCLVKEEHPVTDDDIDNIVKTKVIDDIRERGVTISDTAVQKVVQIAIECLKAQVVKPEEATEVDKEVKSMKADAKKHGARDEPDEKTAISTISKTQKSVFITHTPPKVLLVRPHDDEDEYEMYPDDEDGPKHKSL